MIVNNPLDTIPAIVWQASVDGAITYVNGATRGYLGYPFEANSVVHWNRFVHKDDIGAVLVAWQGALTQGTGADVNARLQRFDGEYRWHKLQINPLLGDDDSLHGATGIATDVHEYVTAGERYEEGERRLRSALEAARVGAWEWNMGSQTATISAQLAVIYGLCPHTAEVPLQSLLNWVPESHRARFRTELSNGLNGHEPFELDFPIDSDDGRRCWLRMRGETESGSDSRLQRAFGVTYDITEQRDAELRRDWSEQRYRALVEVSSELTWMSDADGHDLPIGSQWNRFTGSDGRDAAWRWFDSVHPDDREAARRDWTGIVNSRAPGSMTFRLRRHDGAWRTMVARAVPLFDEDGTLREWFGMAADVTDEHEAAAAIEERNLRLSVAMRAARMTIGYLSLDDWTICWDNARAPNETQDTRAALTYEEAMERVHAEDRRNVDVALRRAALSGEFDGPIEYRIVVADTERWLQSQVVLQRDANGEPWRLIASAVDITRRKNLEIALRESDRRKDEFLAMLAHELRNPLAPMRTAIALLYRGGGVDTTGHDLVGMLQRQVDQMAKLVDDLLEVSRITHGRITLRREPVLVGTAVYGALETVSSMAAVRNQHLTVSLPPNPAWVYADPLRLSQILVNILNNACKYTHVGGNVCVTALADERWVTMIVEDNGSGISAELLPHVFDLFAQGERTLDRSHGGLGIGLSLVRRLVEMHGGTIEITSPGPGRGATVTIKLPQIHPAESLHSPPPSPVPAPPDAPATAHREHTRPFHILIVDDNKDAADSLAILCEAEGYTVGLAYTATEALRLAESDQPDAALLDIGLPEIDGYELARRLRQKGQQKPLLIAVTGYGQAEDHLRTQTAGFDHHLVKPVDIDHLLAILATAAKQRDS